MPCVACIKMGTRWIILEIDVVHLPKGTKVDSWSQWTNRLVPILVLLPRQTKADGLSWLIIHFVSVFIQDELQYA